MTNEDQYRQTVQQTRKVLKAYTPAKTHGFERRKIIVPSKSDLIRNTRRWYYHSIRTGNRPFLTRLLRFMYKTFQPMADSYIQKQLRKGRTEKQKKDGTEGKSARKETRLPSSGHVYWLQELRAHNPSRITANLAESENSFVLVRIIGNDLYPRHTSGQTTGNLRYILEHEPDFKGCQKHWLLNKIASPQQLEVIRALLEEYNQSYTEILFNAADVTAAPWDIENMPQHGYLSSSDFFTLGPEQLQRAWTNTYRNKNNSLMHNNGARNEALNIGREMADWVLPWDGNCFLTSRAWQEIQAAVFKQPRCPFYIVPMQRITDNSILLDDGFPVEPIEEPQIIFHRSVTETFDTNHPYGRRPKVELLQRLGVPGPWKRWHHDPWDQPYGAASDLAGQFRAAGWVARLTSGVQNLEQEGMQALRGRGFARQEAIVKTINMQLSAVSESERNRPLGIEKNSAQASVILERAEAALQREVSTVCDKPEPGPSGNLHDYFHPAPYWWPNPRTRNGLPYIRKDGQRVPGTLMYEDESYRYDRTRLQYLFDDVYTLSLAWRITGRQEFAEHAASWFRSWFILPETRVNPSLQYAQVRQGHKDNMGASTGIIEWKDLYYFLEAVPVLETAGVLSSEDLQTFRDWLQEYQQYLLNSPQAIGECCADNNHGIYFDVHLAAVSAYLQDDVTLYRCIIRAHDRLAVQFTPEGIPLHELTRTNTAHYCAFTLQGWLHMADIARQWGDNLAGAVAVNGSSLRAAFDWLSCHHGWPWPYQQDDEFDADRWVPLFAQARSLGIPVPEFIANEETVHELSLRKSCFHPHDGIRPFWFLAL